MAHEPPPIADPHSTASLPSSMQQIPRRDRYAWFCGGIGSVLATLTAGSFLFCLTTPPSTDTVTLIAAVFILGCIGSVWTLACFLATWLILTRN